MSQVEIDYLGEGGSDDVIARRLIEHVRARIGRSYRGRASGTGKQSLDRRLKGLNAGAAHGRPVLVLRDLDHDAPCPSELVARLIPGRHQRLMLRICVREAETWLMADHVEYARYCGLSHGQVPDEPERLDDPKATILAWVAGGKAKRLARHVEASRGRGVPDWRSLGSWHASFAETLWSPLRASESGRAPSLSRAIGRLEAVVSAL